MTHVTGCEGCETKLSCPRHDPRPERPRKPAAPKDWQCNECGHLMTLKAAERASFGPDGCPKCGGADIDMVQP